MEELYTKKIYYKKFTHRVVIDCTGAAVTQNSKKYDPKAPTGSVVFWLLSNKFNPKEWQGLSTYSYIKGTTSYSVFFKDKKVLDYLERNIGQTYFQILEKPLDDNHVELLENNDKLVTRKQLFYGKYRMCLRVSPKMVNKWQTSTTHIQEMKTWCRDQFGSPYEARDRYMMSGCRKGNFYFAEAKDALLFKLTWGGEDVQTERVVTYKELEDARVAKA